MIYRFLLASDESLGFRGEIKIDADDTFLVFHESIMKCVEFDNVEMTSFVMCDDDWRRKQEITLAEVETDSDVDSFVMEEEVLSDWFDDEKEKLMFIFDYYNERGFYIELAEIIFGKNLSKPTCRKQGEPPVQFLKEEKIETPKTNTTQTPIIDTDDEFYGDEDYDLDLDEIDVDGFEGLDDDIDDIDDIDLEIPEDTELL